MGARDSRALRALARAPGPFRANESAARVLAGGEREAVAQEQQRRLDLSLAERQPGRSARRARLPSCQLLPHPAGAGTVVLICGLW